VRERYRTLVASIPEVVWTVDKEGNVTFMSAQVEKILGYSMAELYRQGATVWFNAVHPDDRQRVKQAFESLFKERRPYDVECRAQRKNGEWFWAHDRAVATTDKNGVRIATGLLSDITAVKGNGRSAPEAGLHRGVLGKRYHRQEHRRRDYQLEPSSGKVVWLTSRC
jgi:PAS domain S-box-containing protein